MLEFLRFDLRHLSKHDSGVAVKERNTRKTLAILEAIDNEWVLRNKLATINTTTSAYAVARPGAALGKNDNSCIKLSPALAKKSRSEMVSVRCTLGSSRCVNIKPTRTTKATAQNHAIRNSRKPARS